VDSIPISAILRGTGMRYKSPPSSTMDRRLENLDIPGKHLWTVFAVYNIADPEDIYRHTANLDMENIVMIEGPACFKCERLYSRKLAKQSCKGSINE
jgi:hypothetical protein